MNYVSPSYESAMRVCIADSCRSGREPCKSDKCTAYHTAPAVVAPIKSSTPRFPDMPISMEESSPLANWRFWVGLLASAGLWTLIWLAVQWVRS